MRGGYLPQNSDNVSVNDKSQAGNFDRPDENFHRGPGRRPNKLNPNDNFEQNTRINNIYGSNQQNIQQNIKIPMTLDIKFDINQPESTVKEDALDKYQENAFLLGKIFSEAQNDNSSEETSSSEEDIEFNEQDYQNEDIKAIQEQIQQVQMQYKNLLKIQEQELDKIQKDELNYKEIISTVKSNMQIGGHVYKQIVQDKNSKNEKIITSENIQNILNEVRDILQEQKTEKINQFDIEENEKNKIWLSCENINDQMQAHSVQIEKNNGFESLWSQSNQSQLNVLKL